MTLSELIAALEAIKAEHGNLPVLVPAAHSGYDKLDAKDCTPRLVYSRASLAPFRGAFDPYYFDEPGRQPLPALVIE